MHEMNDPILNASAIADPSQPKVFELIFPHGFSKSASMIEALCIDGRFKLCAPSRVARESFLLAIGIANFSGIPADLNKTTVLFPRVPPDAQLEYGVPNNLETNGLEEESDEGSEDDKFVGSHNEEVVSDTQYKALEDDMRKIKEELFVKNRALSDLQRRLAKSESDTKQSRGDLTLCRQKLKPVESSYKESQTALKLSEKRIM